MMSVVDPDVEAVLVDPVLDLRSVGIELDVLRVSADPDHGFACTELTS
jgi:hypothetical protein